MPMSPSRPCSTPRCPNLQPCPTHARARDKARGTAHSRGYTYRDWIPFRRRFLAALVAAGIVPVCGAALPSGPSAQDSQCQQAGLLTFTSADGSSLHLDHDPALEDWERHDVRRVCDEARVVLLCQACHARKTAREMACK